MVLWVGCGAVRNQCPKRRSFLPENLKLAAVQESRDFPPVSGSHQISSVSVLSAAAALKNYAIFVRSPNTTA
jgi:hypothetical protein